MSGSYVTDGLPGGLEREIRRLEVQAELSWREELRVLHRAGLGTASDILEIGCGPGVVTERLLAASPSAIVTAMDVRADLLARAATRLSTGAARVRFVRQSILDTDLAEESFDLVIARLVLQHVGNAGVAVSNARRLLRPGGTFVAIDVDAAMLSISEPFSPELAPIYAQAEQLQRSRAGDRFIGRKLWRLLAGAGFRDVVHEAFVYSSDQVGLAVFEEQMHPDRLVPALDAGLISPHQFALVRARHQSFFAAGDSFVMMLGFAASGTR